MNSSIGRAPISFRDHRSLVGQLGHDVGSAYRRHIIDTGREPQFIVLAALLLTFAIVRAVTHSIRKGGAVARNLHLRGVHIHHLVPGILLLIVTGYLSVGLGIRSDHRVLPALFGVGVALTLDEFALWLHLEDVYWSERGKRSIHVVTAAAVAGGLVLLGLDFWTDVITAVGRFFAHL